MNSWDNTNKGILFPPNQNQQLGKTGKLNVNGEDRRIALILGKDNKGETTFDVYVQVGRVWQQNEKKHENSPDVSGKMTIDGVTKRLAGWRNEKDGKIYTSLMVSDLQSDSGEEETSEAVEDFNDEIPF